VASTACRFCHSRLLNLGIAHIFAWHHDRKMSSMRTDRIEFISEYCDRWCERCAFTSRCAAYAVQAALGMCGDLKEALQLAVGVPMAVGGTRPSVAFEFVKPTRDEQQAFEVAVDAHAKRIKEAPMTKHALEVAVAEHRWLHDHAAMRDRGDAVVREAVAVILRGSVFIGGKLARALHGSDDQIGQNWDDDPVQNDWNGSAKIALIAIERSEAAWQTIAQATGDVAAAELASSLASLRGEVEDAFPFARLFKRPGFDEL
jgi:hypothetical protein